MNILILYKSKYGATKAYVNMLKQELNCDAFPIDQYRQGEKQYDFVIYAGGIYASGIAGLKQFQKLYSGAVRAAIFCVGASPYEESALAAIRDRNLTGNLKNLPLFYGRGAWDESNMTFKDRTLCRMLHKAVSRQNPETCEPWMKALMEASGKVCDWTDRSYLTPLFSLLQEPPSSAS